VACFVGEQQLAASRATSSRSRVDGDDSTGSAMTTVPTRIPRFFAALCPRSSGDEQQLLVYQERRSSWQKDASQRVSPQYHSLDLPVAVSRDDIAPATHGFRQLEVSLDLDVGLDLTRERCARCRRPSTRSNSSSRSRRSMLKINMDLDKIEIKR
jgi:hypothetical protein